MSEEIEELNLKFIPIYTGKINPERLYKQLQQENQQLKRENEALKQVHEHDINMIDEVKGNCVKLYQRIEKIKHILNNQMDYREYVDIVNAIEEILKGDKE